MPEPTNDNVVSLQAKRAKRERGEFFAIDRRAWSFVAGLGSMNAMVAYLILARGTQQNMRTTSWSANAIENVTSIPWSMAKKAIQALIAAGAVTQTEGFGKRTKPRYHLAPAHEIPGCEAYPWKQDFDNLSSKEKDVIQKIKSYGYYSGPAFYTKSLIDGCLIEHTGGNSYRIRSAYDAEAASTPDWIWLPNAVVDGAAEENYPPIERIRQTADLAAMRLFVELYGAQSLHQFGGVHWRELRQTYERQPLGERGEYAIWGFRLKTPVTWTTTSFVTPHLTGKKDENGSDPGVKAFWKALEKIEMTGLIGAVGHLIDADTDEGAILHPLPSSNQALAEPAEVEITAAAHHAGVAMLTDHWGRIVTDRGLIVVPVKRHLGAVQLVGLYRMRYRAKTSATAAWLSQSEEWAEWAEKYRQTASDLEANATSRSDIN